MRRWWIEGSNPKGFAFKKLNICPWHSWIARQTPTLKVEGSNPFGQAKTKRHTNRCAAWFLSAPWANLACEAREGSHSPRRAVELARKAQGSESSHGVRIPFRARKEEGTPTGVPLGFCLPLGRTLRAKHVKVRIRPAEPSSWLVRHKGANLRTECEYPFGQGKERGHRKGTF